VNDWQQIVIAVLVFLGGSGGLVAIIRAVMDRPKTRADAVKIIAEAATVTVSNLSARLDKVERQAAKQADQIGDLTDYIDRVSHWAERNRAYLGPPIERFPEFAESRGNHA